LTGPSGASVVFGPQKGADPDQVLLLDRALGHLAAIVHRDLGVSPVDTPGSGAAGGLGFGLLAFCGARLKPGVEVVMQACGFQERLMAADLVITGEGSFDAQSLRGKVPAGIMREAGIGGVPVVIVCGRAEVSPPGATVVSLLDRVGETAAMQDARGSLVIVAEELASQAEELVRKRL
jgi:glycerate kinase